MKRYTSVLVSKVLAWSSDTLNPVVSEYIVMEKSQGRQLVEVWGEIDQLSRFRLIKNLARLESELASIKVSRLREPVLL